MPSPYLNADIAVSFDKSLCTHCERCIKELPEVFNLSGRPWVNMDGAPTDWIIAQVEKCESQALTYERLTTDV